MFPLERGLLGHVTQVTSYEQQAGSRENGIYMKLAGRPAVEVLEDVGGKAAAIVAIGSWHRGGNSVGRPCANGSGWRCRSHA